MVAERTVVRTIPAAPSAIAQRAGRESLDEMLRAASAVPNAEVGNEAAGDDRLVSNA
jgi:hypothetical protein